MSFDFENDRPIFIQIIENIKIEIISKKYLPNQKLPSVREFSMQFEVNPNTVQKALNELESIGLIYTERTNGKYVTNDITLIDKVKNEIIAEKVKNFYISMDKIGIKKQDVIDILKDKQGD